MRDLKFDQQQDLVLGNDGDPVFTESLYQHQSDLLYASQGDYKEYPQVGVNSREYINDHDPSLYLRNVKKNFMRDGMRVSDIRYNNGIIEIEAEYEDQR